MSIPDIVSLSKVLSGFKCHGSVQITKSYKDSFVLLFLWQEFEDKLCIVKKLNFATRKFIVVYQSYQQFTDGDFNAKLFVICTAKTIMAVEVCSTFAIQTILKVYL